MKQQTISPFGPLRGEISVPGDKSISHRSIMLGSLASGTTEVHGFLQGEDSLATLRAFRAMGIAIEELGAGRLRIAGQGLYGLQEPADVLDCGNSGTTMRLMLGLLSGQAFFSVLSGDQYLRRRPMKRVVGPLSTMGARIWGRNDGELAPLAIQGGPLQPAERGQSDQDQGGAEHRQRRGCRCGLAAGVETWHKTLTKVCVCRTKGLSLTVYRRQVVARAARFPPAVCRSRTKEAE